MFESYRPHSTYSTSASLQNLHYSPHRQQRLSPPKLQPTYSSPLSQSQSFPSELDTVLRHSTSSKILHRENDIDRQAFHQPITRKMTKVIPSKFPGKIQLNYKNILCINRRELFIIKWSVNTTT
jgi:hypothetical protein